MSKITYTNKVTLNDYPDIANINKCTAGDLNEIKTVVNENDDNVGVLNNLNTTTKTNIVSAINEVNTALNTVSIAKMITNEHITIPVETEVKVTGIWDSEFQVGDYVCDVANGRIIVRNTEILETSGLTGGQGPAWNGIVVRDENEQNIGEGNSYRVLNINNGYWSLPFPTSQYYLDKTKTYYVYLFCRAYNSEFILNGGMGDKGTTITARKIK